MVGKSLQLLCILPLVCCACLPSVYISSVYSPFSDRVGLPLHNNPSSGVLMKSIGVEFVRPDALPGVNHMRGMQNQIVINIAFCPKLN